MIIRLLCVDDVQHVHSLPPLAIVTVHIFTSIRRSFISKAQRIKGDVQELSMNLVAEQSLRLVSSSAQGDAAPRIDVRQTPEFYGRWKVTSSILHRPRALVPICRSLCNCSLNFVPCK